VRQHEEDKENLVPDRRDREEVDGDGIAEVIAQEGGPCGRGSRPLDPVLLDGGLGHVDPDLPQLADDPRGSPERIGRRHLPDQRTNLPRDSRSAGSPGAREPPPVLAELPATPRDHGPWLDEHERLPPAGPDSRQPGPQDPVAGAKSRPLGRALVDGELMPQGHDLELHRESGSEEATKERRESEKQGWHRYHLPGCWSPITRRRRLTDPGGMVKNHREIRVIGRVRRARSNSRCRLARTSFECPRTGGSLRKRL
jgi:hypothetical protein